jgi:SAM-dependent methyltransferase
MNRSLIGKADALWVETLSASATPRQDALARAYNDVPYTSAPDPARHPDRLATLGMRFGIDVAPLESCRVLEFACGDGANLVSMAALLPKATFVGFDIATRPIERARAMADALGLSNVTLLTLDLRDLPDDLGVFDYVIAHGLYSWLPDDVRDQMLPAVARHLAPNGVAFVSFNALPGSHVRAIAWDMLAFHTRGIESANDKLDAARHVLGLAGTPAADDDALAQVIRAELRKAAQSSESSLAHDDLGPFNRAVHFTTFISEAMRTGLQFVAEANPSRVAITGLAAPVRQWLLQRQRLEREQYVDFFRLRQYRETLLCHAGVAAHDEIDLTSVRRLYAVPSLATRQVIAAGTSETADDPDIDAVLRTLITRWPLATAVPDVAPASRKAMPQHTFARSIEAVVVDMESRGLLDLRVTQPPVASHAGERPHAFDAARWLSRERAIVPTVYHEGLRLSDATARKLVGLLDGTRNRAELCRALGGPFNEASGIDRLERALDVLAKKAVLVA